MTTERPIHTVERLLRATNAHDLDGIVACFADDYALEAPLHPARSFRGAEQVRRNWSQILQGVPDIAMRIVASAVNDDVVWSEWEMAGTRRDGAAHLVRGVFIFAIGDGLIRRGRMFLEPVDAAGADMDTAVRALVAPTGKVSP
jgi:ketosteroid isomerase-like protein